MSSLDTDCQSGRQHAHRLANTDLKTNQFLSYCNNVPQYLSWVWNFLQTSTCSAPADRPRRVVQIKFALYSSLWLLSLWMNTYWLCRPPVCEAEMTYDRVSISFLHLQPQLISSHSVDLLEIKQPRPWLCVRLLWKGGGGDGIRFWWLVLMTLILGPFFICQSAEWHYTFLSPSLFAYSLICHMRGPDNPPSGDEW